MGHILELYQRTRLMVAKGFYIIRMQINIRKNYIITLFHLGAALNLKNVIRLIFKSFIQMVLISKEIFELATEFVSF
jgi:hypothetical protein